MTAGRTSGPGEDASSEKRPVAGVQANRASPDFSGIAGPQRFLTTPTVTSTEARPSCGLAAESMIITVSGRWRSL